MKRLNEYWTQCEHCEKLWLSLSDYQCNCNQPERSKREDLSKFDYDLANFINGKIDWNELKMRCSEHDSNAVREVQ